MDLTFICAMFFMSLLDMMKYCFSKILFQLMDWSCYLHCWSNIRLSSGTANDSRFNISLAQQQTLLTFLQSEFGMISGLPSLAFACKSVA